MLVKLRTVLYFLSRNVIIALPDHLKYDWQTSFVSDFVVPVRENYECYLKQGEYSTFTRICSQGHWSNIITEVSIRL